MLQYRGFSEIVDHPGLRIVLVQGMPSPWGQAAKTIFEIKGLDYVAAPWLPGEPNADIVAWGGEASAPIVAWAKEKPRGRLFVSSDARLSAAAREAGFDVTRI